MGYADVVLETNSYITFAVVSNYLVGVPHEVAHTTRTIDIHRDVSIME